MEENRQRLLAIGGGMELEENSPLVQTFLHEAGGKEAIITVIPVASDFGFEVGPLYADFFREFCNDVKYYLIDERGDAERLELIERLKVSTGIFFTGGNQLRITALIGGTTMMAVILEALEKGVIIAGTSAGAAAMPSTMIRSGPADTMLKGSLQMSPGMNLVDNMVIDSHFIKRGRISRLMHLVSENPGSLGVGLAENTGILIDRNNSTFEVIGSHQAVIVDGKAMTHTNMHEIKENRPFSVLDVKVHVLGPHYSYNYVTREVIVPTEEKDIPESPEEVSDMPYRPKQR